MVQLVQPKRYMFTVNAGGVWGLYNTLDEVREACKDLKNGDIWWVWELTHKIECEMRTPTTEIRYPDPFDPDEIPF